MGKVNRNTISFDKDFLNTLKNDINACVNIHTQIYHLALHPFHLTDLNSSVKGLLNKKIAKYDNKLNGILLGYQNIKLLDSFGAINSDSCFIHTNIQADFYIFNPAVGQVLNGVVNKKSKDHVGCLVHRTFNISLPKPENCENWIGQSAQIGQEIKLEIIFADLQGKLPYIKGNILSILSDDSGFSTSEEQHTQHKQNVVTKFEDSDTEVTHKPKKKKKRKSEDSISMNVEVVHELDSYTSSYIEKHKEDQEITQQNRIIDSNIEIRKLKKKKKDKPVDSDIELRKLKKKKKERPDNSDSIDKIDSDFEKDRKLKKLSDKVNVDVEMKKSKKRKHKYEDNVILDNVEMSYNEISETHKKHKHKTKKSKNVM